MSTLSLARVEDDSWFWDLVGEDPAGRHVPLRAPAVGVDGRFVWLLLAVPLLVPLELAVLSLSHVSVPGWLLLLETLAAFGWLGRLDGRSLAAQGISAPPWWSALLPPLYLHLRSRSAWHPTPPFTWVVVAAVGVLALSAIGQAVSPVALRSDQVEGLLYQDVFVWEIPLDPGTAVIRCPRFDHAWVGERVSCTGRDATRTLRLEVTPRDRAGHVTWRVLPG